MSYRGSANQQLEDSVTQRLGLLAGLGDFGTPHQSLFVESSVNFDRYS